VSPLRLRQRVVRVRRIALALFVVAAVSSVVVLHHAMPVMAAGDHHDMGATTTMEICVAVLTAVGAAALSLAATALRGRTLRAVPRLAPRGVAPVAAPPLPRARAGPIFLCVIRR
jgi:hypothetical protein